MRTLLKIVGVVVVGGALLLPIQTAKGCAGRKFCSICAAKAASRYSGFPNYGYGNGYNATGQIDFVEGTAGTVSAIVARYYFGSVA